jgi:NADH dehydrogenase
VILVDLGHAVLGPFSPEAHDYASRQLHRRGVTLRLGVSVTEVGKDYVQLSDGNRINTRLVVWGGGEMAAPLAAHAGIGQGHGGRVDVLPDLTVDGTTGVYALGDMANIPFGDEPSLPQLGSVAQQSGEWAARNILADLDGAPRQPFAYRDKGIMAMIGRKAAIAEIGAHRHELHGRIAFAAWLGVHAELLSNMGAELNAFVAWAEEFYLRPHKRSAQLLNAGQDGPRKINW